MQLSGSDLAFLITTGTGALVALIVAIQKSKCSSINVCWDCIKCIRSSEFSDGVQTGFEHVEKKSPVKINI